MKSQRQTRQKIPGLTSVNYKKARGFAPPIRGLMRALRGLIVTNILILLVLLAELRRFELMAI
jgi:hypothetical protein